VLGLKFAIRHPVAAGVVVALAGADLVYRIALREGVREWVKR
jgi:hypothetical protein